jgi:transcriptional regulator with XRE-family HTH domain
MPKFPKFRNDAGMESRATRLTSATSLGALVRQRRRAQALRIDDAAALLGVSQDLMSRFENGQGTVRLDKVLAVLDGLGLTLIVAPKEHPWVRQAESTDQLQALEGTLP